jgi:histidine ammonia-lyase
MECTVGTVELNRILLGGTALTCELVSEIARVPVPVEITSEGLDRAKRSAETSRRVAGVRPVYGRTTGVGANRLVDVSGPEAEEHGLRLMRSHAAGAGPLLSEEIVRAMLAVRLNQLAVGGSGVSPGLLQALADVLNQGLVPPVHSYGAIGTGDLTALACTALCLRGERAWSDGRMRKIYLVESGDVLGFLSSNAATLGEAALAAFDLRRLLDASTVVAALSLFAVHGSLEPYAPVVHEAVPHPGQQAVAASVRALLSAEPFTAARIQDPYGYRAFPQVHGPALDSADHAAEVIHREINAAAENPLIDLDAGTVWHNGNFHTAYVGLALDAARAALFQTVALSAARLGTLVEPSFTGLPAFQAHAGSASSSGIMILEYVAHSAIADIRRFATPAALGSAVLSRGVEEHAGFSTQSARATTDAVAAYRIALACELVAAVRALRMQGRTPTAPPLRAVFDKAAAALDPRTEDRPLDADLTTAAALLTDL